MTNGIEREPTFSIRALYSERHAAVMALAAQDRHVGDAASLANHLEGAATWRRQYRDALRHKRAMEAQGFIFATGNDFDCIRFGTQHYARKEM